MVSYPKNNPTVCLICSKEFKVDGENWLICDCGRERHPQLAAFIASESNLMKVSCEMLFVDCRTPEEIHSVYQKMDAKLAGKKIHKYLKDEYNSRLQPFLAYEKALSNFKRAIERKFSTFKTQSEVREFYRKQAFKYHPDKQPSAEIDEVIDNGAIFKILNSAYDRAMKRFQT